MQEVSRPIIAITLVLCAVFVPVAFVDGLTGQFYRQFALTIAISTVISAFNSLTLSPALAAVLLKPHDAKPDALTRGMDKVFGKFFQRFNRGFAAAGDGYSKAVTRTVRRAPIAIAVYAGLIALTWYGLSSSLADSFRNRTRTISWASCSCRPRPRSIAPMPSFGASARSRRHSPACCRRCSSRPNDPPIVK